MASTWPEYQDAPAPFSIQLRLHQEEAALLDGGGVVTTDAGVIASHQHAATAATLILAATPEFTIRRADLIAFGLPSAIVVPPFLAWHLTSMAFIPIDGTFVDTVNVDFMRDSAGAVAKTFTPEFELHRRKVLSRARFHPVAPPPRGCGPPRGIDVPSAGEQKGGGQPKVEETSTRRSWSLHEYDRPFEEALNHTTPKRNGEAFHTSATAATEATRQLEGMTRAAGLSDDLEHTLYVLQIILEFTPSSADLDGDAVLTAMANNADSGGGAKEMPTTIGGDEVKRCLHPRACGGRAPKTSHVVLAEVAVNSRGIQRALTGPPRLLRFFARSGMALRVRACVLQYSPKMDPFGNQPDNTSSSLSRGDDLIMAAVLSDATATTRLSEEKSTPVDVSHVLLLLRRFGLAGCDVLGRVIPQQLTSPWHFCLHRRWFVATQPAVISDGPSCWDTMGGKSGRRSGRFISTPSRHFDDGASPSDREEAGGRFQKTGNERKPRDGQKGATSTKHSKTSDTATSKSLRETTSDPYAQCNDNMDESTDDEASDACRSRSADYIWRVVPAGAVVEARAVMFGAASRGTTIRGGDVSAGDASANNSTILSLLLPDGRLLHTSALVPYERWYTPARCSEPSSQLGSEKPPPKCPHSTAADGDTTVVRSRRFPRRAADVISVIPFGSKRLAYGEVTDPTNGDVYVVWADGSGYSRKSGRQGAFLRMVPRGASTTTWFTGSDDAAAVVGDSGGAEQQRTTAAMANHTSGDFPAAATPTDGSRDLLLSTSTAASDEGCRVIAGSKWFMSAREGKSVRVRKAPDLSSQVIGVLLPNESREAIAVHRMQDGNVFAEWRRSITGGGSPQTITAAGGGGGGGAPPPAPSTSSILGDGFSRMSSPNGEQVFLVEVPGVGKVTRCGPLRSVPRPPSPPVTDLDLLRVQQQAGAPGHALLTPLSLAAATTHHPSVRSRLSV